MKTCNTYDIDGVIFINKDVGGIYPGPTDIIITGRSFEEELETSAMLADRGIKNSVFYNSLTYDQKSRETSGKHKAKIIKWLFSNGTKVLVHFEDDEVQAEVIRRECPDVHVVLLVHNLTNKENMRHVYP
jgi:hypothetical protein